MILENNDEEVILIDDSEEEEVVFSENEEDMDIDFQNAMNVEDDTDDDEIRLLEDTSAVRTLDTFTFLEIDAVNVEARYLK